MKHAPLAVLVLFAACAPDSAPTPAPAPSTSPSPEKPPTRPAKPGTLNFDVPAGWVEEPPSNNMRKAQYRIPDKEKTAGDAELVVFYFGASFSETFIEDNTERWAAQVEGSEPKSETFDGKCRVTLVDLQGVYTADSSGEPLRNARMLGGIVEAKGGPWYLKLVGPADTVGDWREEFIALLKSAYRAE